MIAYVSGRVSVLEPGSAVVDVGGVGFAVQCTPATLAGLQLGAVARVSTTLVVREESLTLFGFADDDERDVFELLQTASGVGPKVAQAMLAVHGPDALRRAVAAEDLTTLMQVPGIGRKGAQRIVLELKDRLGPPRGAGHTSAAIRPGVPGGEAWRDQVRDGLVSLGWNSREADEAVGLVAADLAGASEAEGVVDLTRVGTSGGPDIAALMRAALRTLSRP